MIRRFPTTFGLVTFTVLMTTACVSTTLETPENHPANPKAQSEPLAMSRVLQKDFDASNVAEKQTAPSGDSSAARFTCPMHPEIARTTAGKCPICGMNLVKSGEAQHDHSGGAPHNHGGAH